MSARTMETVETGRYLLLDVLVALLAAALVVFLIMTMGVRNREQAVVDECHERLLALSTAQQSYLVQHGTFAEDLEALRPFLEGPYRRIPFQCPISGYDFQVRVQGERYIIVAPGSGFSVHTGDPNW